MSEFPTKVVAEWNMKRNGELPALVTNNVRNIINAGKLTGLHLHVGCLAHVINLATQRGLKVARMGRIANFFSTTALLPWLFKKRRKLSWNVSTRRNSSYDMLNRYFEQRIEINATSMSKDVKENAKKMYTLSGDDSASVKRMIQILKPLKTVTTTLCVEKISHSCFNKHP